MPELTADKMVTWHIYYRDGRPPEKVQAVYPTTDDTLPGWVVLKDHKHQIVAMVPSDAAGIIKRCPNDPKNLGPLVSTVLADGSRGIACLPAEFAGFGQEGDIEMALRTRAIRSLMAARLNAGADPEFYAYLSEPDGWDGGDLYLEYGESDSFGPYLRAVLTGYKRPEPAVKVVASPGVTIGNLTTGAAAGCAGANVTYTVPMA